jgi:hypothetical protein
MTGANSETWGITRKLDLVHYFRNSRTICEGKNHRKGWLFIARPDWTPTAPDTCPVCLRVLELEQIEQGVQPPQSH